MTEGPRTVVQMRFSGSMGGAESVAFSLAKVLAERIENSVLYLVLEDRGDPEALDALVKRVEGLGVRSRLFHTGSRWSFGLFRELEQALQEDAAEIVHAHCYKSAFYALAIKRFGSGLRGVVFTLHGLFDPWSPRSALIHAVNAVDVICADKIIACSGEISAKYRKYPILGRKIDTIQNCLFIDERHDLGRIATERHRARQKLASMWGLDESALWVASVGRLTGQKNFPLYFQVAKEIISSGGLATNVQFLVVGDGELRGALEGLVSGMGLSGHVFFTSFVSEMDTLLTGIDLLMVTSLWEGTPMCVLEAMAYGKPVVSTAVGGMPYLVRHGETGILAQGSQPADLARAAVELLADSKRRESMGRAAHSFITTQLSQGNWADRHCRAYRQVMDA